MTKVGIEKALIFFATLLVTAPAPTAGLAPEAPHQSGVEVSAASYHLQSATIQSDGLPGVPSTSFHRRWTEFVR